jgi:hypothetical protein
MSDYDSENQSCDHDPSYRNRNYRAVNLSADSISGYNPGLAYRPAFALLIPSFITIEANNQIIKVSLRLRAVRKSPDVKRVAGFSIIRDSIRTDVENGGVCHDAPLD